ncbi:sugar transferase [Patescibacteria group bacterium]
MKKSELIFNVLLVPLDFIAIIFAALTSYYIRYNTNLLTENFPVGLRLDFGEYFIAVLIGSVIFIVFMAGNGLYVLKNARRLYGELFKVFFSVSAASLAIIILLFFTQIFDASRFLVLSIWLLAILFISVERIILRIIQKSLFKRGKFTRKIVLLGKNQTTKTLKKTFDEIPKLGYTVIDDIPPMDIEHTIQRLKKTKNSYVIDEIIQANPDYRSHDIEKLVDFSYEYHVDFKYTPDIFESHATNIAIRTIAGIPVIELKKTPLDGWGRVAKRIMDLFGGIFGVLFFGIPMLIVAIAIKIDDRGPIIYKNERINHKGEKFYVYKFRSYKPEYCVGVKYGSKEASKVEDKLIKKMSTRKGPLHKIDSETDPRITRIGNFIRKSSLDELPQFFNVVKGDLSLVGPRPHTPKEVAKYEKHHQRVLTVKPGVTGLPQTRGRSDLDFEEEVRLDIYYIENWTLLLDLKILFTTPFTLLKSRKAA